MNNALWSAIFELYQLLTRGEMYETSFQSYFDRHPIVFEVLGFSQALSFEDRSMRKLPYDEQRSYQPYPDFICSEENIERLTVFEIKTPIRGDVITSRSDGNRAKLKAIVETYLSQVMEYIDFLHEQPEARRIACTALGLKKVRSYRGMLIYGFLSQSEIGQVAKLVSERRTGLELIGYNQLLDRLVSAYSRGRRDTESTSGLSIVISVTLFEPPTKDKAYLVELGRVSQSRISLFCVSDELEIECVGDDGRIFSAQAKAKFSEPIYIRIEISNDENNNFICCNIDNVDVDLRLSEYRAKINPDLEYLVVGADQFKSSFGFFKIHEWYLVAGTFNIEQRLRSYEYFLSKKDVSNAGVVFNGNSFLVRRTHGDLYQDDERYRPQYESNTIETGRTGY